jgi:hypothetical protein
VFAQVAHRLEGLSATDPVRWHNLVWFVTSWAYRRRPGAERSELLAAGIEAIENVNARVEYQQMSGRTGITWEQELLQRGAELGEQRGAVRALQQTLRNILRKRADPLPAEVEQRIQGIESLARLEQLIETAARVNTLDEMRWDGPST